MKVRSALLTEMSGKIGGAVASRARGGIQYFRKLVTPSNPRSFLQTAMRNGVTSASAAWTSILTELQQQAWWDLSDLLGTTSTGKTLFAKVNQPRYYVNNNARGWDNTNSAPITDDLPVIAEPPGTLAAVAGGLAAVVIDDSANTITIPTLGTGAQSWINGADGTHPAVQYVFVSAGQPPSRFSRAHPYQLVSAECYYSDDVGDATSHAVNLAALGLPTVAGYVMYVKRYIQAPDGSISIPTEDRVTIVA